MVDFGWSHPDTTQLCSPVLPVTGLWHGDILLGGAQPAGTRHLYRSPVQTAFTVVPPRSLDFKGVAKMPIFSRIMEYSNVTTLTLTHPAKSCIITQGLLQPTA